MQTVTKAAGLAKKLAPNTNVIMPKKFGSANPDVVVNNENQFNYLNPQKKVFEESAETENTLKYEPFSLKPRKE